MYLPIKKACTFLQAFLWSRGESNPCPNIATISFLHAYFTIAFRNFTGNEPTNEELS